MFLGIRQKPIPLSNGTVTKSLSRRYCQADSPLYERYIGDILCIVKKSEIDKRLATIQGLHHCLSFTHELESNGKLPFLDMMINNENGKLSSSWYRKPTATDLTLNFHALAPLKYKRSVVSSFVYRIYRACSSWKSFHESLNEAKVILIKNQYPPSFIENIIYNTLNKFLNLIMLMYPQITMKL